VDEVGVHYDPMIAKLIAWGEDRDKGTGLRMRESLAGLQVRSL
jgi:acetyl/propionyl-CoA carboxylase alpha subunit